MPRQILLSYVFLFLFLISCKEPKNDQAKTKTSTLTKTINENSLQKKLINNIHFIGNNLLKGKEFLLKKYISKYQPDTCGVITYEETTLKSAYEGVKNIGDINGDNIMDTIFVVPPFNYCDDGYSYSFFDISIPRLYTDSYCCHPDNLFSIGDIDEDEISEICIFYSSCVSRYKSLIAYSLKNTEWKQIGRCTFDINFMNPSKEQRVKKIVKGKFEMLEIVDDEKNKKWIQFSF